MVGYEVGEGRATLTIDDPERRNPMSVETMRDLRDRSREALEDADVRVIVVTGAGDKAFSAGGDLSSRFVDDPVGLHRERGLLADLLRTLRHGGKPTVARVNGHALAGGFGLALACDITIAVEDARMGMPEVNVGLWPMMISGVVGRMLPSKAALELMMTGRLITAKEALALGAVSRVVPRDRLDEAVDETVAALLEKSPATLLLGRDAFYATSDLDFDSALDRLQGGLTAVSLTEDAAEGVEAFKQKRSPRWVGR